MMDAMRDSDSDGESAEADLRSRLAAVDTDGSWWHRDKLSEFVGADADAIKRAFKGKGNIKRLYRYEYRLPMAAGGGRRSRLAAFWVIRNCGNRRPS